MKDQTLTFNYFVDTEFSSLDLFGGDLLTAYIIIDDMSGNTVFEKEFKCKPLCKKYWEIEAERIHGITWKESLDFPELSLFLNELMNLLEEYPLERFISHTLERGWFDRENKRWSWAHVDYNMIKNSFEKLERFDQWEFMRLCHPSKRESTVTLAKLAGHKSAKLNLMCEYYNIELNHHVASSDAKACRKLWYILKKQNSGQKNHTTSMKAAKDSGHHQQILL